jgi:putative redox protein
MEKRARVAWRGGLDFAATDMPGRGLPLAGSDGSAAYRPAALLLVALAGCSGMDTISILVKKRQVVTAYEVQVDGRQRDSHPKTYERIDVEHVLEGVGLDETAVARAIELTATRYCVANAHLSAGDTEIHHRYRIRDAAGERSAEVLVTGPHGAGLAVLAAV